MQQIIDLTIQKLEIEPDFLLEDSPKCKAKITVKDLITRIIESGGGINLKVIFKEYNVNLISKYLKLLFVDYPKKSPS